METAILEKSYKVYTSEMPQAHDPNFEEKVFGTHLPYESLEKQQIRVYQMFFPEKCKFEQYNECIPETAINLAKEIVEMPIYNKEKPKSLEQGKIEYGVRLEIWGKPTKKKDPVLVAIKTRWEGRGDWVSSVDTYHLVSQWGEMLLTYEEIYAHLFDEAKAKLISFSRRMKVFSQLALEDVDGYASKMLSGDKLDFELEVESLKEGFYHYNFF